MTDRDTSASQEEDDYTIEILSGPEDEAEETRSKSPTPGPSTTAQATSGSTTAKGKGVGKSSKGKKGDKTTVDSDMEAIEKVNNKESNFVIL